MTRQRLTQNLSESGSADPRWATVVSRWARLRHGCFVLAMLCVACSGLSSLDGLAAEAHPARAWTAAEQAVFRQALSEWLKTGLSFREIADCRVAVDFTVRWENASFFKKWDDEHDWSGDWGRVLTADSIPAGWGDVERRNFPVNEIYFRDQPGEWFVDPTPADDSEYSEDAEGNLRAKLRTDALHKMDFLTIAKHEIGHVLGLGHNGGVMQPGLEESIRRHPSADEISAASADAYTYKFMPVPEPGIYAMLLVGLGLLGLGLRRGPQTQRSESGKLCLPR